jgi:small-conductance mechanosensitive channel
MLLAALRLLALALLLSAASSLLATAAVAQQSAPPAPVSPAPADAAPKVDPAALDHLIQTLQDPKSRDAFIADLKALQALRRQEAALPALPRALGAELLQAMSDGFGRLQAEVGDLRASLGDPAHLWSWVRGQVEDSGRRAVLLEFLWQLVLILAGGALAGLAVRYFIRTAQARLTPAVKPRSPARIGLLLAHSALELLPILAFAAVSYAVVAVVQPGAVVRLAMLAVVSAVAAARVAFVFCLFLLSPFVPVLRLFPLGDETAGYLYVWARRLIALGVYGYLLLQVALLLGLPESAYALGLRLLGLAEALLVAAVILQSREPVARAIARGGPDNGERIASLARLRRQLAQSWHVLALSYLAAVYVTGAADVPGGFAYLGRGTGLTVLALMLAWLALALLRRGFDRFMLINRDLLARSPLLEQRANRYLPLLRTGLALLIRLAALAAILGAWRIDIGALFASPALREIIGRLATILLMLGAALAIWEIVNAAISFYLDRRGEDGRPILTSARARTLLPLVRNAVFIVICLMAGLTILAELGVNIAPLLAGAGVVGLAIGFGAQTLVKDVITGAFILFEDTVNVGDVASINGISGQVEAMSIRTLKLRDGDGTLHTIPFGTVATVSNMTRDYGYYAIDVGVGYGESTDRVIEALRAVFDELAREPAYRHDILGLEVMGVDRFTETAVQIRGRIKTRTLRQWEVGREFNRRMKMKFDELGIQLAPPPRLLYVAPAGEPKGGTEGGAKALPKA